jgi:hypothetical protein
MTKKERIGNYLRNLSCNFGTQFNNILPIVYIHPMTIFFKLFNVVDKNDFLNKILKNILVSSSYIPLL